MSQDLTRIFAHFLMDHFDGSFLTDDIAVKKRRIAPFFNGYSGSCWHSIITTPSGSLQLLAWERPTKRWYLRRKKCINYSLFASLNGGCNTLYYILWIKIPILLAMLWSDFWQSKIHCTIMGCGKISGVKSAILNVWQLTETNWLEKSH